MKTHARNTLIGAVLVPVALAIATFIANEAQLLLGLDLDRVALALYLIPFLLGCAGVMAALLRLEATKIGGEVGDALGDLVTTLFGPPGEGAGPIGSPGASRPPGAPPSEEASSGSGAAFPPAPPPAPLPPAPGPPNPPAP